MTGQRYFRFAALSAFLFFSPIANVQAQSTPVPPSKPSSELYNINTPAPDPMSVPTLARLMQGGAKVFYLGERSGLFGWFIVKNRQIQMVYVTPDKKTVFVGGMFSVDGENITGRQVSDIIKNNNEIKSLLEGAAQEEKEVFKAGAQPGGAASLSSEAPKAASANDTGSMPAVPVSPGERLVSDLKAAAGVVLGKNEKSEIFMVVAPKCPNCKGTWKELRQSVQEGKVQIRLIPVFNSVGDEEKKMAAQLLRVSDPLSAWDRFVEGDKAALEGEPDATSLRAIMDNLGMVARWNIQGYPYLVYRGSDGRIKIVQGRPERMAAILTDITK